MAVNTVSVCIYDTSSHRFNTICGIYEFDCFFTIVTMWDSAAPIITLPLEAGRISCKT